MTKEDATATIRKKKKKQDGEVGEEEETLEATLAELIMTVDLVKKKYYFGS